MSKRVQTTNLNLYAYENLRGLPTFLKDWSDNMLILDGAYVTVNGLISALDTRLTTAEGTLEDLSPESIEDYKIRLDALEKKVVINTSSIKDVNTRIGTINAQINSINVEQGVQNSRLTALEGVTANHTSQINSIIGDISSVTDRVTTLEQCCETVQHEIADMQSDINGFNDDLTVLATQFETVSGVVSELTDLVNSLQLDVVSQRLDTFESDLNALTASVTSLGGRMTDAENQIELNGNAINENALDIASIESEMGNTDYSEVGDTVSSAIVELADRIRNLTPQEYDTLVQAIQDAEQEIDGIQALIPDDATSSNKLITLNDVVIPSVNIASVSRAGIVKVGQRLSVQSDGTLDADNQIGDSSYGLVKSVNDNASGITIINNALTVSDPSEGSGLITFGVDNSGNYGYKKVGADTVIPFKTGDNLWEYFYDNEIGGGIIPPSGTIATFYGYYNQVVNNYPQNLHIYLSACKSKYCVYDISRNKHVNRIDLNKIDPNKQYQFQWELKSVIRSTASFANLHIEIYLVDKANHLLLLDTYDGYQFSSEPGSLSIDNSVYLLGSSILATLTSEYIDHIYFYCNQSNHDIKFDGQSMTLRMFEQ